MGQIPLDLRLHNNPLWLDSLTSGPSWQKPCLLYSLRPRLCLARVGFLRHFGFGWLALKAILCLSPGLSGAFSSAETACSIKLRWRQPYRYSSVGQSPTTPGLLEPHLRWPKTMVPDCRERGLWYETALVQTPGSFTGYDTPSFETILPLRPLHSGPLFGGAALMVSSIILNYSFWFLLRWLIYTDLLIKW